MGRQSVKPRVGFVLGGGGMLGAAWLAGAMGAVAEATGLDPREADLVVGTSAGSAIGALATCGIAPEHLSAYACGQSLEGLGGLEHLDPEDATSLRDRALAFTIEKAVPLPVPGSLRMALATLKNPLATTPTALVAGWVPKGPISTRPIREGIGALVPAWPERGQLWAIAADHRTGRRVALGSANGPPAATPAEAVAASCAIPGFYRPVKIGDRCYVDGGVCSASNLDVVLKHEHELDLVVCLNPMSAQEPVKGRSPQALLNGAMRAQVGRRLGHEAQKVRRAGTQVVLLQPGPEEVANMGLNLMRKTGREELAELAARSVQRRLRATGVRRQLRALSTPGDARRPKRPAAVTPYVTRRAA